MSRLFTGMCKMEREKHPVFLKQVGEVALHNFFQVSHKSLSPQFEKQAGSAEPCREIIGL